MNVTKIDVARNDAVRNRGGRPSLEDVPRRNEHLLAIATDNFIRHGYAATTLDRIAAEAGVAKRTIYARYPDKQALFFTVVQRLTSARLTEDLIADDDLPLRDALRQRAQRMIERGLSDRYLEVARLLMVELPHFPELGKTIWKSVEDQLGANLIAFFRRHQDRGDIREIDLALLAELFLFNIYSFTNRVALRQRDKPSSAEIDAFVDTMVTVMLQGIEQR